MNIPLLTFNKYLKEEEEMGNQMGSLAQLSMQQPHAENF